MTYKSDKYYNEVKTRTRGNVCYYAGLPSNKGCCGPFVVGFLKEDKLMAVDAAFADLDVGVSRLQAGLEVDPDNRDMKWGSQRCVYSRFVHKNI